MKSNPAASARCASATSCFGPACSPITVYPNDTIGCAPLTQPRARLPNPPGDLPAGHGLGSPVTMRQGGPVNEVEGARTFGVAATTYDSFMGRYSVGLAELFSDAAGVAPGQTVIDV